ncbi:NUDIX domain-containing protein [Bradyrhizobium sp. WSM 1744]|uniref:NUDIX domain-containing protein n=1 Tax=Bradyrhizobium archetypum TaxID=2721160 RepID=A0A7Y4M5K9_9BRAD|nr:NUDIX domain-containing protein [Bradyrhizobium archetypum]
MIAWTCWWQASKRGRVLLVRRRRDKLWLFPGGRRRGRETAEQCLWREIKALCGMSRRRI